MSFECDDPGLRSQPKKTTATAMETLTQSHHTGPANPEAPPALPRPAVQPI